VHARARTRAHTYARQLALVSPRARRPPFFPRPPHPHARGGYTHAELSTYVAGWLVLSGALRHFDSRRLCRGKHTRNYTFAVPTFGVPATPPVCGLRGRERARRARERDDTRVRREREIKKRVGATESDDNEWQPTESIRWYISVAQESARKRLWRAGARTTSATRKAGVPLKSFRNLHSRAPRATANVLTRRRARLVDLRVHWKSLTSGRDLEARPCTRDKQLKYRVKLKRYT